MAHLSKSEICDKTWSTESLKELLSDMTAKDQIELFDNGYKIKQNEAQDDFDDNCNFVKNTQIDCTSSVSDNLVANLETVIIPETQQTPLLPSDLSVTPRRPIKSVYNDNTQSFISFQNMFLKEIETMKNFTKSVEKKFEEIENFITSLSVNNHSVGTPEKEKESEREYPLVVELLKSRVSTLEKQLAEKDAIIDFLLNQKVQNEIDNTTFISKVSNSDIQRDKNPTNCNIKNSNSEKKIGKVKIAVTGDSVLNGANGKGLSKSHNAKVKHYPGATSEDILDKIDDLLKVKPDCLLVHVGTNDLTNNVNLLNSVKK